MAENRGRGNNNSANRGRSQSRARGGGRNFFNKKNQERAAAAKQSQEQAAQDDTNVAKAPDVEKTHQSNLARVEAKVDIGRAWSDKFYQGVTKEERGNIKANLNHEIVDRMIEPYTIKLNYGINSTIATNFTELQLYRKLHGIISIAFAVKLYKSATEFEKTNLHNMTSLRFTDMKIPKKLQIMINQIGKTDLSNDNLFRIRSQNLYSKRYLLYGIVSYFMIEERQGRQIIQFSNQWKIDDVYAKLKNSVSFDKMYDRTWASLDYIRSTGKKYFERQANENFDIAIGDVQILVRLPAFKFKKSWDQGIVDDIVKYLNNALFSKVEWTTSDYFKIACSLIIQAAEYHWLKNKDKPLKELNREFAETKAADVTFRQLLDAMDLIDINDIISDDNLDQAALYVTNEYNAGCFSVFDKLFQMEKINFTDYGTDAQLIEGMNLVERENIFGDECSYIEGLQQPKTKLKTSAFGSLMGISLALTKDIEISQGFRVNFDGKPKSILSEFVKSDFKS